MHALSFPVALILAVWLSTHPRAFAFRLCAQTNATISPATSGLQQFYKDQIEIRHQITVLLCQQLGLDYDLVGKFSHIFVIHLPNLLFSLHFGICPSYLFCRS